MDARAPSNRNNTPLLLLLDGILSQNEQSTGTALAQLQEIDPSFRYPATATNTSSSLHTAISGESPLRSASALEVFVRRLLAIQPHLAQVPSENDGSLPLHFAASIGNIRVASLLLSHYREAALTHNTKGKIPLHYAAREGRTEMVAFLLRYVPDCAAVLTKKGKLALHFAAGEGHVEIVRNLLRVYPAGAILPSKKGKIAMHFAARWGHIEVACDLYRSYPESVHTLDYDGSNPLHDATREGQFEMAKFLVERCPDVMHKANIRGEIPLFAAIRSRNVPLCTFLVRAWPGSGKQVLQTISDPDDITSWEPVILDLCLRGAVDNFSDASFQDQAHIDDYALRIIDRIHSCPDGNNAAATNSLINGAVVPKAIHTHGAFTCVHHQQSAQQQNHQQSTDRDIGDSMSRIVSETSLEVKNISTTNQSGFVTPQKLPLDISLPRSKSPILETDDGGKKRSAADGTNENKRQRRGSIDEDDEGEQRETMCSQCSYKKTLVNHKFYQLHAALESSVTTSVLNCVLESYPDQQTLTDDYGRLPLHIAASHCRSKGCVDLILEKIWKNNEDASMVRDYFGRLPLHLALMTRADSRLVRVLLQANPSSGVQQCQVVDERFTYKLPIHMAMESGCDLSVVFMLVRGDPAMVQTWKCP